MGKFFKIAKEVWDEDYKGPEKTIKGKEGYSKAKAVADKKFGKKTSLVKNMWISKEMKKSASVEYRGHTFPGYNKPRASWKKDKKKVVLAKKGDKVKIVHFGAKGYGHNYSAAARKSYLARSAKIKGVNDKFSANYWARKVLWAGKGGSTKSSPKGVKGKY